MPCGQFAVARTGRCWTLRLESGKSGEAIDAGSGTRRPSVAKRFVDLAATPQSVKQHGGLPSHGDDGAFLRGLAASLAYSFAKASQVTICPVAAEHVLRAAHEQSPQ